jgi:glyoxylate carboligase
VAEDGSETSSTVKRPTLGGVQIRPTVVERILDLDLGLVTHDTATDPTRALQDKLRHTVRELEAPGLWREQGDWNLLVETHKRLIKEAEKLTLYNKVNTDALELVAA